MPDDVNAEQRQETFSQLVYKAAMLSVNYGLFDSVMGRFPEHAQEGFIAHMQGTIDLIEQRIEEVQSFGEAFDNDEVS